MPIVRRNRTDSGPNVIASTTSSPPSSAHARRMNPRDKADTARVPKSPPQAPKTLPSFINIPDVRQATGYTCGTASLMSLLSYYDWRGDDQAEKYVAQECGTTAKNGTEPEQIMRVARKYGLKCDMKNGMTLSDVEKHLAKGEPVMVAYQAWTEDGGPFPDKKPWSEDWIDGHWSIIIGMDADNVYLEDPSMLGKRGFIPKAEFLERWHDTDDHNDPVYRGLGIAFSCDSVPKSRLNTVVVKNVAYIP